MLQLSVIKDDPTKVIDGLLKKKFKDAKEIVDNILKLDDDRRKTQYTKDSLSSEINDLAKKIGEYVKQGRTQEAERLKLDSVQLKESIKHAEQELKRIENELLNLLVKLPNLPHITVPDGISSEDNLVIKEVGQVPSLPSNALPHWELIRKFNIIDFELGVKLCGAGFPVYINKGAKLQRALIQYFLDKAIANGYEEVSVPLLVNETSGFGTGQLPDKDGQMYRIESENLYLIPTAEVPITNLYRDEIIKEEKLPIKKVGYTPCFRKEAGSWGAHVRGLNRLHQFDKVEIVQIVKPEDSYETLHEMVNYVSSLLDELKVKYRIVKLCSGDLGFTSALTYDFETWSAVQQKWLEVSSVSNFETFQSNRLKLRFKNKKGKTELLHTLNGSALALPRIMATILENNQCDKGIKIPEVLQPYTGFGWIE